MIDWRTGAEQAKSHVRNWMKRVDDPRFTTDARLNYVRDLFCCADAPDVWRFLMRKRLDYFEWEARREALREFPDLLEAKDDLPGLISILRDGLNDEHAKVRQQAVDSLRTTLNGVVTANREIPPEALDEIVDLLITKGVTDRDYDVADGACVLLEDDDIAPTRTRLRALERVVTRNLVHKVFRRQVKELYAWWYFKFHGEKWIDPKASPPKPPEPPNPNNAFQQHLFWQPPLHNDRKPEGATSNDHGKALPNDSASRGGKPTGSPNEDRLTKAPARSKQAQPLSFLLDQVIRVDGPERVRFFPGEPTDVAVDRQGNVYALDSVRGRVQVFDNQGKHLRSMAVRQRHIANDPIGVSIDRQGNVCVAYTSGWVTVFDNKGTSPTSFGGLPGDWQLWAAADIHVDATGKIFVADPRRRAIQVFDHAHRALLRFSTVGRDDVHPVQVNQRVAGVASDAAGRVIVADRGNHRILVFAPSGDLLLKFGTHGDGDGQMDEPEDVDVDTVGNIYVADTSNHRIQVFESSGNFLTKFGSLGEQPGEFHHPTAVAVGDDGKVYVADSSNERIEVFSSGPDHREAPRNGRAKDESPVVREVNDRLDAAAGVRQGEWLPSQGEWLVSYFSRVRNLKHLPPEYNQERKHVEEIAATLKQRKLDYVSWEARSVAAARLPDLFASDPRQVIPILCDGLNDPHPKVRAMAVGSLARVYKALAQNQEKRKAKKKGKSIHQDTEDMLDKIVDLVITQGLCDEHPLVAGMAYDFVASGQIVVNRVRLRSLERAIASRRIHKWFRLEVDDLEMDWLTEVGWGRKTKRPEPQAPHP